ncbi:putative phage tail protein [Sutterella sp.]|uniref:putative phage tail protein n=1 Tax=Sutterella sp. TaxID=1981025 RepID=UPI0026DEA9E7|nr:putative phage tail protein [Sutterella sp.]MDO5531432.1 DUF2313 domain-containing protein [Sutterella sp.]
MAHTESDYRHLTEHLLPRGPIWKPREGGLLDATLYALSREAARIDGRLERVLDENDARTSTEMLETWFSDWGVPSECITAILEPTTEQKRQELLTKIVNNTGLSAGFFKELAAWLGYTVDITTTTTGELATIVTVYFDIHAGGDYRELDVTWDVTQPLAIWGQEILECIFKTFAPAHVKTIFRYEADETS